MSSPDLIGLVEDCCDAVVVDEALAPLHAAVQRDRARLREPIRVAVCGQLSAGKSTLVNALVGRPLAPTGQDETTEANWWFRAGRREEVRVARPGGESASLPLGPGSRLDPAALGPVDLDRTGALEVVVESPFLAGMTVIDTPGLFSPNAERSDRTHALLMDRTTRAAALADALVYVTSELPGAARDDEQLREFQALFGAVSRAPTNAVLVLTKVDRWWHPVTREPEPLVAGHQLLAAHRDELEHRVWDAVPVVALLAERVLAHGLAPGIIGDLRLLGDSPDSLTMLLSRELLLEADAAIPHERRGQLYDGLGPYGLRTALDLVAEGCEDIDRLGRELYARSGLDAVRTLLDTTFRNRSDVLRADALLESLDRLALARHGGICATAADRVRGWVEAVRTGAHGVALRELDVLRRLAEPGLRLGEAERAELRRLFSGVTWGQRLGSPPEGMPPLEHAARRRDAWRLVELRRPAPLGLRRIAAAACLAYEEAIVELERPAGSLASTGSERSARGAAGA